jgi:hypothetical protein
MIAKTVRWFVYEHLYLSVNKSLYLLDDMYINTTTSKEDFDGWAVGDGWTNGHHRPIPADSGRKSDVYKKLQNAARWRLPA